MECFTHVFITGDTCYEEALYTYLSCNHLLALDSIPSLSEPKVFLSRHPSPVYSFHSIPGLRCCHSHGICLGARARVHACSDLCSLASLALERINQY